MSDARGRPPTADGAALRALAAARTETRAMSDRLLDHLPDVGDLATQRLLDAWVEQAADTLRALSEAAEERLLDLGRREPTGRHTDARMPPTTSRRRRSRVPRKVVAHEPPHRRPRVRVGARRRPAHPVGAARRPRHRPRRIGVASPATATPTTPPGTSGTCSSGRPPSSTGWARCSRPGRRRPSRRRPGRASSRPTWPAPTSSSTGSSSSSRSGPSRVDPEARARERQRLQELLNRVTMVRARELARLGRELQQSHDTLATVADDARAGRSPDS